MNMAAVARAYSLFGSSSLSSTSTPSPFRSFGPVAVAARATQPQSGVDRLLGGLRRAASFTVDEAKRRMSGFFAKGGADFVNYLADNLLGIEHRSYGGGRPTLHIVDRLSAQSVPAAAVDARLSDAAVKRLVKGHDAVQTRKFHARAVAAEDYRARLSGFLRDAANGGKPPFHGWEDVAITVPATLKNRAYTVRDGVGYVGISVGECGATKEETASMLAAKRAELAVKFGVKASAIRFVHDAAMAPGTPILVDDRNLVEARAVSPSLSADKLAAAFGQSFEAHFAERARKSQLASGSANVVNIREFKEKFTRKGPAAPAPEAEEVFTRGAVAVNLRDFDASRIVIQSNGDGTSRIWNAARQREVVGVTSVNLLPEGVYAKEDVFGMPVGTLKVDAEGNVTHFDMKGREHNLEGASFEPAPGAPEPRRWSIEGDTFSRFRDYKAAREAFYTPAAQPEAPAIEKAAQTLDTAADIATAGFGMFG
jgi:hypothetical protein